MVAYAVRWSILAGLYLLFAGQPDTSEIVAGILVGAAGAALSLAIRNAGPRKYVLRVPWRRVLASTAHDLATGTLEVGAAMLRPARHSLGRLERQAFRPGGPDAVDAARRGVVTLARSLAPDGFVVDLLEDRDELLMHTVSVRRQPQDAEWPV